MTEMGRKKRVGLREVAERAGVSIGTASRVFNGKSWISPETHKLVRKAAEELGYLPGSSALRDHQKQKAVTTVGLIVRTMEIPLLANPFYLHIFHAVEQICSAEGISLMYASVEENMERIEDLPMMIQRQQVQGLLVLGYFVPEFFSLLQKFDLPIVLVDHELPSSGVDVVNFDDEQGGYLATRYLLDAGHSHPAIIAGPLKYLSIQKRLSGYRRALASYGIAYDEAFVRWGDMDLAGGYREMLSLLEMQQPPTAVFCCNDLMAVGAMGALRAHNRAIPEDCSIVGYDDIALIERLDPPLTTIRAETALLGKQGLELLLERIMSPTIVPRRITFEVRLIERESVRRYS